MAEGVKLLDEALSAGAPVESVYWAPGAPSALLRRAEAAGARLFELAPGVLERVADAATPQPVLSVLGMVDVALDALAGAGRVVVAAGVADPGNAGTLLRSALASGADGVVFTDGSVDPYNPKAVRASAGALFRLPVVAGGPVGEVLERLGACGLRRLGAVASGGVDYTAADLTGRVAVVVGSEAHGLGPDDLARLDELVSIPMSPAVESLNVGVATAVLCFEAARQARVRRPVASGARE